MTEQAAPTGFTTSDLLTGQLAGLIPSLPQETYEAAAAGLIAIGWRPAASASVTEEILTEHSFLVDDDGDGWNEPRSHAYSCSCTKAQYGQWMQKDLEMTGLSVFLEEGRHDAMALHHAHVAEVLLAAGGGIAA